MRKNFKFEFMLVSVALFMVAVIIVYIILSSQTLEAVNVTYITTTDSESSSMVLINVNTATQEQLEQLSGIGPEIAKRIIEYRQDFGNFTCAEDLLNVKGIGEKKLNDISESICFN